MALKAQTRRCVNHPERPGHAICMKCRSVVCQECATQWDGINYCVGCLAELRRSEGRRSSAPGWLGLTVAVPVLFWAASRLMVWTLVLVMELVQ